MSTQTGSDEQLDYGDECILQLANGGSLRCPPFPEECDYVRVVSSDGKEIGYWIYDEWVEDPQVVMGAIIGAAMAASSA